MRTLIEELEERLAFARTHDEADFCLAVDLCDATGCSMRIAVWRDGSFQLDVGKIPYP